MAGDVAQRMLQRMDSCASVDPFAAQQQQQQQHVAAGAGMQQHYHSTNSLQAQVGTKYFPNTLLYTPQLVVVWV